VRTNPGAAAYQGGSWQHLVSEIEVASLPSLRSPRCTCCADLVGRQPPRCRSQGPISVVIAADSNVIVIGIGVKPLADTVALHSVKSHSASPAHREAQLPPRSNRRIAHESLALLAANRRKVSKHLA
jgi:hypothetical protein